MLVLVAAGSEKLQKCHRT